MSLPGWPDDQNHLNVLSEPAVPKPFTVKSITMRRTKKSTLLLTGLFAMATFCFAQPLTQTIRGNVTDAITKEPLIGASIMVLDMAETTGTISELDGQFLLEKIPVGRHSIQCSYIGYETQVEILLLNSAKEGYLDFKLSQANIELTMIKVRPPSEALNPLSMVSVRSIAPEETQYYPAGGNDFSRSVVSLPGVQPTKDNENDVVIRGNSGAGAVWRLEGVDILNPNHFARRGSSGGGVTIFSISVLDKADFSTGAFPAEYGNALSGIFDLHFRSGNKDRREYTFRAGMMGLDLAAEGPFGKRDSTVNSAEKGSYLFNYRYSTLGILNQLGLRLVGERVDNNFQDLSFNLDFPGKKGKSNFNVWGLGGLSMESESAVENPVDWQVHGDSAEYLYKTRMGVIGAAHNIQLDAKSFLKTSLAVMAQQWHRTDDLLSDDFTTHRIQDENYVQGRVSLASVYTRSFSRELYMKTGFQIANVFYDLQHDSIEVDGGFREIINGKGANLLVQPYLQCQWTPLPRWTFNAGLHAMYFGLTNSLLPEPRLGVRYVFGKNQSAGLAYGLHSMHVPIGSYFTVLDGEQPNLDLDLIKAHHIVVSYDWLFASQFRLHGELYYQHLFDVPVGIEAPQTYWLLNTIDGYSKRALVSKGKGNNYGLDLMVEKFFRRGAFFLFSTSLFKSTYQPLNGETYSTQYDSRFLGSFTIGKEWEFKNRNSSLQIGMRSMYSHGMPSTPLLNTATDVTKPIFDESNPFSERAPAYFRIDSRVAFRKNKPSAAWMLAIDVQNVTNYKNKRAFNWGYDLEEKVWYRKNQAGVIPVLSFQLDF